LKINGHKNLGETIPLNHSDPAVGFILMHYTLYCKLIYNALLFSIAFGCLWLLFSFP
jgi:hypothetical protein